MSRQVLAVADSLNDLAGLRVDAESLLAGVLEAVARPIWVVDPDGVIRLANRAGAAMLGYESAHELLGHNRHELVHHREADGAAECPGQATGETVTPSVDWLVRRDGSRVPVSSVSVPIEMAEGHGAVIAFGEIEGHSRAERALRDDNATLIGREASLRRIATLVAGGAASADVYAAVAREVARVVGVPMVVVSRFDAGCTSATVIGGWSDAGHPFQLGISRMLEGPTLEVLATGRAARADGATEPAGTGAEVGRKSDVRAAPAAPIIVDGKVWGAITVTPGGAPLPDRIENRLAEFTDLIAPAIANTESRTVLDQLTQEQAALRRVATLVLRGTAPDEVFTAVVEEVGRLLEIDMATLVRYEPDETLTFVATWGRPRQQMPVGSRRALGGKNLGTMVFETGRPARIDDYAESSSGPLSDHIRGAGIRSSVGSPIMVDGLLWGMIAAGSVVGPLPLDTETRLENFTELVSTAISHTQSRAGLARLVEEQAGLRRVATLAAHGTSPEVLFAAVVEEVGRVFPVENVGLARYESDATMTTLAISDRLADRLPVGGRWPLGGKNVSTIVFQTSRSARVDTYGDASGRLGDTMREQGITSAVGAPIVVEDRLWGVLTLASNRGPLPADTETRLASFTELVATTIANTEARAEVGRLLDEQAALRRVATLVARQAPPHDVFAAVAEEAGRVLHFDQAVVFRFEDDRSATLLADSGTGGPRIPLGSRLSLEGDNVAARVLRTGRSARMDGYAAPDGPLAERGRRFGMHSVVGGPVVVDGRLWGAMVAGTAEHQPLSADAESRIAQFTELVATAISNVDARTDLAASRARIAQAADEERRRVVRDLHDGAQQRLVHTIITLKMARRALQNEDEQHLTALMNEALEHAERATSELRELVHGILPADLTEDGLHRSVQTLAARAPVPVENAVSVGRLPPAIEAAAYFVVAESLTNVAKHAHALSATVTACVEDNILRVQVRDDGIGGARPDGSGLLGLADRLAVLNGQLRVESPADGGTLIAAEIPIPD